MAPLQKAGIVALVKNRTRDMTLAIGDGDFPTYVRSVALCFPEPNFGEHKELRCLVSHWCFIPMLENSSKCLQVQMMSQ